MVVKTEGRHAAEFVLTEMRGHLSRGNLVIGASQTIVPGTVLGKVGENEGAVTVGAPSFAGTGDGVLTKDATEFGAGAQEGTYKITLIEAVANGGVFEVTRPDGTKDGQAVVGTLYAGQVRFTIADGTTDFAFPAEFSLAVTIAAATDEGEYKALDVAATDGAEYASAIALYPATTGVGETTKISGIVRLAEVNGKLLTWPAGITADQKAAAIAQLAASNIEVR